MGVLSRFMKYRKWIFVCIVSLNVVFFCLWIYVAIQKQTPIKAANHDQLIDELFPTSRFELKEITESDVTQWQKAFYTTLARVKKRHQEKPFVGIKRVLALYEYNKGQLNDINQLKLPRDEPGQSQIKIARNNGLLQFLETSSCKPISPDVVLYNRVFKTGSETTGALFSLAANMMDYIYTKQTTEDFYDEGISTPYPMIIEQKVNQADRPIFFNAHFYFRNDLKIQQTHTYINQIREPVARYISHYAYMRTTKRPKDRVRQMIQSGEFNETIEQCFEKQGQGCKHNVMTRFFCGIEDFCKNDAQKALERAKENILNHYAVVGLLEHFQLTLKVLQRRLPYFLPVVPRDPTGMKLNEGRKKLNSSSVSEEMIGKIKQANWADVELYEFVKEIFWRQVQACGIA